MKMNKLQIKALENVERGVVWDEDHGEYFYLKSDGARAHVVFDLEEDGFVKKGPEEKMGKRSIYRYSLTEAGKKALEEARK